MEDVYLEGSTEVEIWRQHYTKPFLNIFLPIISTLIDWNGKDEFDGFSSS